MGFVHNVRMFSAEGNERRKVKRGGTLRDLLCVVHSKNQKYTPTKQDERLNEQSPAKHCKDIGKNFTLYIIFYFE